MDKSEGGPAFPTHGFNSEHDSGMSLRDYFAAKAMQGMCSSMSGTGIVPVQDEIAKRAYEIADAMLQARESAHA